MKKQRELVWPFATAAAIFSSSSSIFSSIKFWASTMPGTRQVLVGFPINLRKKKQRSSIANIFQSKDLTFCYCGFHLLLLLFQFLLKPLFQLLNECSWAENDIKRYWSWNLEGTFHKFDLTTKTLCHGRMAKAHNSSPEPKLQYPLPTHGVDLERVVVAILVNVAKQRPATHLFFTSVGHREFHLRRKGENFEQKIFRLFNVRSLRSSYGDSPIP